MSLMREIQKELEIRKRIFSIYVKQRDDFDSKEAFDDYLEQVEDLVFKLSNNIDVIESEQKIREYEAHNRIGIQAHRMRLAGDTTAAAAPVQTYQPTAVVPTAPAAQPTPVGPVEQSADGVLQRRRHLDKQRVAAAAAAAGWSVDIVQQRALQEAFRTMFVF